MIPGEIRASDAPLELNARLARRSLVLVNDGDRPIQTSLSNGVRYDNPPTHYCIGCINRMRAVPIRSYG